MPNYVLVNGVFTPFTYTVSEVDAMFSVIPISRFGDMTDSPIPVTNGANSITLEALPAFLAGHKYNLEQTVVPIPATPSTTFYLYLKLSGGVPGIVVNTTPQDETLTQMYIGSVVTDGSGAVTTTALEKVTRIDIYRLSAVRRGTAIPVSTGDPTGPGNFAW